MQSHVQARSQPIHRLHRAPDPAPIEEAPTDPFDNPEPHQAPIRTPMNDDPVPDPNPSVGRALH